MGMDRSPQANDWRECKAACQALAKTSGVPVTIEATSRGPAAAQTVQSADALRSIYYQARKILSSDSGWNDFARWHVEILLDMAQQSKLGWHDFMRRKLAQLARTTRRRQRRSAESV